MLQRLAAVLGRTHLTVCVGSSLLLPMAPATCTAARNVHCGTRQTVDLATLSIGFNRQGAMSIKPIYYAGHVH